MRDRLKKLGFHVFVERIYVRNAAVFTGQLCDINNRVLVQERALGDNRTGMTVDIAPDVGAESVLPASKTPVTVQSRCPRRKVSPIPAPLKPFAILRPAMIGE